MNPYRTAILALIFGLSNLPSTAFSAEGQKSPEAQAKALVEEIFSRAGNPKVSEDSKLQEKINQKIDFSMMASETLGTTGSKRSRQERNWFENTLKEIITRTIYPSAPDFLKSVKIKYKKVKLDGKNATVTSTVRSKGERTQVAYTLRQVGPSEWRVIDVAIDGESWVENIREQVRRTIRKQKWSGLEKKMNRRLASLRSGNSDENTKKAKQAKRKRSSISDS